MDRLYITVECAGDSVVDWKIRTIFGMVNIF